MKRTTRLWWTIIAAGLLAAPGGGCGVGEHENPFPPNVAGTEQAEAYTNAAFGVAIDAPAGWTWTESADKTSVEFTSADVRPTLATVTFEILDPAPASLLDELVELHPEWTYITATTAELSGYFFDDPAAGAAGGDVREYFFLGGTSGDVLVQVHVEFFPEGKGGFDAFLAGIHFE